MFTPPGSPLPSPRAKLDQPNPMEEIQRRATNPLLPPSPSSGLLSPPSSPPSYFPSHSNSSSVSSGPSKNPPSLSLSSAPTLSPQSSSSSHPSFSFLPTPSTSPLLPPPLSTSSSHSWISKEPSSSLDVLQQQQHQHLEYQYSRLEAKRRIGRHIKWTAIAIPLVLILLTLGNHCRGSLLGMVRWGNGVKDPRISLDDPNWLGQDRFIGESSLSGTLLHHQHQHHGPSHSHDVVETAFFRRDSSSASMSVATAGSSGTPTDAQLATATTTAPLSSSSIPATAQNLPTVPSSAPVLPTPFPQPWDSDIPQNFSSQTCYNFFLNMTNDNDFRSCRPFGMLQATSDDFSNLQSNLTELNAVVWGTCNTTPGVDQCASTMATFASSLQSACSKDLSDRNLNAVTTLQALQAYSLTTSAGCLTDPSTESYCYVKAAHNSNPSDLYFYSLTSGTQISNTTTLTCSSCTKSLMSLYVNALNANASQFTELAGAYQSAQALASTACGPTYAQVSTGSEADTSGGVESYVRPSSSSRWWRTAVGGWMVVVVVFWLVSV
jgi:hypothetical protein